MTSVSERRPERVAGRVPPHSVEAEESVLGSILLSVDAANEVMDKLDADDFYVPAHQAIFRAIHSLYNSNQAIDAITVSEELRRTTELERVGGVAYVTRLIDVVPSAANVEYYSGLVEEYSQRRHLIRAGSSVHDLAFRLDDEISTVLDRAEQTVLAVAGRRVGDSMASLGSLFSPILEELEALEAAGSEVTGLSTGFRDLDRKLTGLHPANLIIIAARPAMGKCLVGSTMVVDPKTGRRHRIDDLLDSDTIATAHVGALDLDTLRLEVAAPSGAIDNGVREVFRVTTRLGRRITATANHPFLTFDGWRELHQLQVGDEIAVPGQVEAFGVDELPDAEVAMLGYLIGDGDLSQRTPRFTNVDPRVIDDVSRWAEQLGCELRQDGDRPTYRIVGTGPTLAEVAEAAGVSVEWTRRALHGRRGPSPSTAERIRDAAFQLGYHGRSNPLRVILERHGLAGATSHDKAVPEAVFRLPERQLALFLSRLYATDGSAWVSGDIYRIEYATVSERLARDLQHLLLRFGVVAKVRRRRVRYNGGRRPAFDVSFQDPASVRGFAERIGIFSKESAVADVVAVASSRSDRAASDYLPMSVWDLIQAERADRSWADVSEATGRPRNHNWHARTRRPSRQLVSELAVGLGSEPLMRIATSDVIFDPIVSIEAAGRDRTYDIEVPVHHNFIADDIVVHNSALTANVAVNVALTGKAVAFFSLEMSKEEVAQRMLCAMARIDSMKLRTGKIGESAWPRLTDAAGRLYSAPVFVDDSPVVTVTDIRAKCRRLKRQHGLALVVVDYMQLMQGAARENRQQEIAEISRSLKNLARELEVPIIAVSQLNRNLEQREDKRPRLGDLRESGSLEQDADIVIFIYRDEYYNEATEQKGIAEVIVAKHRAGSTGKVDMTFMPEFTRFSDLGRD